MGARGLTGGKGGGPTYVGMAEHFFRVSIDTPRGRALLAMWFGVGATVALRAAYKSRKRARFPGRVHSALAIAHQAAPAGPDGAKGGGGGRGAPAKPKAPPFKLHQLLHLLGVAVPVGSLESLHLAGFTGLLVLRVWLSVRGARLQGTLGKYVGARAWDQMFAAQVEFGLWAVPAAVVNAGLRYETNALALGMRERLAAHFHRLLTTNRAYYRATAVGSGNDVLEGIDARVTNDIDAFTVEVSKLWGNLLKPTSEVILYTRTLGEMMGYSQLGAFFVYFVTSSWWLQLAMPPFGQLTAYESALEGDVRSLHNRLLTYAEEIAFYKGGEREKAGLDAAVDRLSLLKRWVFKLRFATGILDQYTVKYGGTMMAFSMMLPAVYLGRNGLADKDSTEVTGYYLTATSLFTQLSGACKSLYMSGYKGMSSLAGLTLRLAEMQEVLVKRGGDGGPDQAAQRMIAACAENPDGSGVPPLLTHGPPDAIRLRDVDVVSPDGTLLVRGLTLDVVPGSSLVIEGANGCGKSSLLRTLCGLWPLCGGQLELPEDDESVAFLPQRPYFCVGTLRENIMYPHTPKAGEPDETEVAALTDAIAAVGLSAVVQREGGWEAQRDWMEILSGGEKQRLAIARLFYRRPRFAVMDEATSAVSGEIEQALIRGCHERNITIISVSHRPALRNLHDQRLTLYGPADHARWTLEPVVKA